VPESEASTTDTGWEARARAAEARVEELAAERARLWDEVHRLRAERRSVEHYQAVATYMENSASWKVTGPLREAKRIAMRVRKLLDERR
jgi:hypothetical protein